MVALFCAEVWKVFKRALELGHYGHMKNSQVNSEINSQELVRVLAELAENDWATSQTLFSKTYCRKIATECLLLKDQGEFKPAAIGNGSEKSVVDSIRGDSIHWLGKGKDSSVGIDILRQLGELMGEFNSYFYLGLRQLEAHFAIYPPGSHYQKHVDNHLGKSARRLTLILYLNEYWLHGDGGELNLFNPKHSSDLLASIDPKLGTVVLFRSEIFPHQVLTSHKHRMSLTSWFRNDSPF
jgi:SM-20-related protein